MNPLAMGSRGEERDSPRAWCLVLRGGLRRSYSGCCRRDVCALSRQSFEFPVSGHRGGKRQQLRTPSMRWRNGVWRFDDVVARTHDASGSDSDDNEDEADRAVGSTAPVTQREQYDVDWDDIDSARRPAMTRLRGSCTPHAKWWTHYGGGSCGGHETRRHCWCARVT